MRPGERLPTSLQLSEQLRISPKTVEKAYCELLKQHLIESTPRIGTFIARDALADRHALLTIAGNAVAIGLNRARRLGCTRGEVRVLASEALDRVFPDGARRTRKEIDE